MESKLAAPLASSSQQKQFSKLHMMQSELQTYSQSVSLPGYFPTTSPKQFSSQLNLGVFLSLPDFLSGNQDEPSQ